MKKFLNEEVFLNGKWFANGKRFANGKWKIENGFQMENGKLRMENGELFTNGKLKMENGKLENGCCHSEASVSAAEESHGNSAPIKSNEILRSAQDDNMECRTTQDDNILHCHSERSEESHGIPIIPYCHSEERLSDEESHGIPIKNHCHSEEHQATKNLIENSTSTRSFANAQDDRNNLYHSERSEESHRIPERTAAFSLIELLISLIAISCIIAAFAPAITKKAMSGSGGVSKKSIMRLFAQDEECQGISSDCTLCFKNTDNCLLCNLSYKDCNEGYYLNKSECKCKQCEKGNYCTGGFKYACKTGEHQDEIGKNTCKKCEVGSYGTTEGLVNCSDCGVGKYNSNTGSTSNVCQNCPQGTYCPNNRNENPTDCGKGKYNSNTNSTTVSACLNCPKGAYCPNDRTANPTDCGTGKYNDKENQTTVAACLNCPNGTYCPNNRNASPTACTTGYYCDGGAAVGGTCASLATTGYYCNDNKKTACNTNTSFNNYAQCSKCTSSACTECATGYHVFGTGCLKSPAYLEYNGLKIMTRNMGDDATYNSAWLKNTAGIKITATVSDNATANDNNTNPTCWVATYYNTANDECTNPYSYSGCKRTVCNWYAANKACAAMGWRLPTINEMKNWRSNPNADSALVDKLRNGASGLQLCDLRGTNYSAPYCFYHTRCTDSYNGKCFPSHIWTAYYIESNITLGYASAIDSTIFVTPNRQGKGQPFSTRCVQTIE